MNYEAYLRSPHWRDVRRRYWASKYPKCCHCCKRKDIPLDLHHKTYKRIGAERLNDLVLLCRPCHDDVHRIAGNPTIKRNIWSAVQMVRMNHRRRAARIQAANKKVRRKRRIEAKRVKTT